MIQIHATHLALGGLLISSIRQAELSGAWSFDSTSFGPNDIPHPDSGAAEQTPLICPARSIRFRLASFPTCFNERTALISSWPSRGPFAGNNATHTRVHVLPFRVSSMTYPPVRKSVSTTWRLLPGPDSINFFRVT